MIFDIVLIIVLPIVLVGVAGIALGRREPAAAGDSDSDSVSFVGGIIGALFTVVLAFYIVFAWQTGADIANNATTESNAVVDAYHQAQFLPEPDRSTVQGLLRSYSAQVAGTEWSRLAQGRTDPRPAELLDAIRAEFAGLTVADNVTQSARENGLADVRQIDESHRARVDLATGTDPLTAVLLAATIVIGILTVVFPLLMGLSARPVNLAVLTILTFMIGSTVFLAVQLTHPLDGLLGVGPDAFQAALDQMQPST